MFFSRATRYAAILTLILAVFRVSIAFAIAVGLIGPPEILVPRYLGNTTTGEAIDQGVYAIAIALALGTLAEIALTIQRGRL